MIVRNGKTTHLIGRDISYIMFENEENKIDALWVDIY